MTRRTHSAHRYRIVSRCVGCGVKMLGACAYRTCDATMIYSPFRHPPACPTAYQARPRPLARPIDYVAIARRIFHEDLIETLPLGD